MRVYKGISVETGEQVEGYLWYDPYYGRYFIRDLTRPTDTQVKSEGLGQFIGRINGERLFEGDIVTAVTNDYRRIEGVIKYVPDLYAYCLIQDGYRYYINNLKGIKKDHGD